MAEQQVRVRDLSGGSKLMISTSRAGRWLFKVVGGDCILPLSLNGREVKGAPVKVVGSQPSALRGQTVPAELAGMITRGMSLVISGLGPDKLVYVCLGEIVSIEFTKHHICS